MAVDRRADNLFDALRTEEEKVVTTISFPKSLLEQIDHYADTYGLTRTEAVISLLRAELAFVDDPNEQPMTKGDYQELQRQFTDGLASIRKAIQQRSAQ